MVTIKRYIGKFKKPLHWRGGRRFLRYIVLPAVTAVLLMLVVRAMFLTQYAIRTDQPALDLMSGDRILVNRAAYGVRTPFERLFGPHCLWQRDPERGDLVVYTAGDGSGNILTDSISALPGDTITSPQRGILPPETYVAGGRIIGHDQLLGRIIVITYSLDPKAPLWHSLRPDRLLLKAYYD